MVNFGFLINYNCLFNIKMIKYSHMYSLQYIQSPSYGNGSSSKAITQCLWEMGCFFLYLRKILCSTTFLLAILTQNMQKTRNYERKILIKNFQKKYFFWNIIIRCLWEKEDCYFLRFTQKLILYKFYAGNTDVSPTKKDILKKLFF